MLLMTLFQVLTSLFGEAFKHFFRTFAFILVILHFLFLCLFRGMLFHFLSVATLLLISLISIMVQVGPGVISRARRLLLIRAVLLLLTGVVVTAIVHLIRILIAALIVISLLPFSVVPIGLLPVPFSVTLVVIVPITVVVSAVSLVPLLVTPASMIPSLEVIAPVVETHISGEVAPHLFKVLVLLVSPLVVALRDVVLARAGYTLVLLEGL